MVDGWWLEVSNRQKALCKYHSGLENTKKFLTKRVFAPDMIKDQVNDD